MALQYELEFADNMSVVGDNTTKVSSYVSEKNNAATNKDCWGNNIAAEIGGMVFGAQVVGANIAGGTVTVSLYTHSANNLNASGNALVTLTAFNNSAIGTAYYGRVARGVKRAKYLGARVVNAGNITAGNVNIFLATSEHVVD